MPDPGVGPSSHRPSRLEETGSQEGRGVARSQAVLSTSKPDTGPALVRVAGTPGAPSRGATGGRRAGGAGSARAHHTAEAVGGRRGGAPSWGELQEGRRERSAVARGAPRRSRCFPRMELRCAPLADRRSPPRPRTSAPALAHAGLLLLLLPLLLRPAGCLGAGEAPGPLSTDVPADLGAPCSPSATYPSGERRFPRQAATSQTPMTLQYPSSKADEDEFLPACGFSYEWDPTLRDPEAMARRWPWMVSVRANGVHICAGTLIASEWVLSVAHCMIQSDATYSVRVGSPWIDQISESTVDVLAQEIIVNSHYRSHRYWSWVGRANDIALLKLEQPLKYNKYVWPICLPGLDYSVKDHTLCTVTGWGLPRVDGVWPQFRTIQEKEVTILNSTECDSLYHRFSKIPSLIQIINSQMICAKDVDREQFCYEISGEPLACPVENIWYLVGMVSWGPGCKKSEAPPIYLHISSYQQWIWERLNGQTLPAPSRALLLALLLPLSLLAVL
ncbi:probable threonine protease PRSS50 [Hippopotamus amphibius kiboko]|uniref:probable threonine protease PRSS50 n=1 Tax=Hippopotamus amphibius kiboko TaxID=575201 RepID=UPI00259A9AFF|nr:probable threonine protease PRSS50 [Hippopotamus amphibius kiboko]